MSNLNNVITLGIQEAGQLILDSIKANTKISWLLVGEPGIAKTSITKWVHEQVKDTHGYVYIDCPSTDVADVAVPMVDKDNGYCTMYPNKLWGLHEFTPKIFNLDEYSKASKQTKDCLHPLFNEDRIGSIEIHPDSVVIATGNLTSDGVGDILGGQTVNRIVVIHVRKPTPEEYCAWGVSNGLNPSIMAFTHHNPKALGSYIGMSDPSENELIYHPKRNNNTGVGYMSPRSLEKAGKVLDLFESLDVGSEEEMRVRDKQKRAALQGTVGAAGAAELMAFLAFADEIPSPREIMADPKGAVVPAKNGAQMMVAISALSWAGREWEQDGEVVATKRQTMAMWWEYMYKAPKDPRNLSMETIQVFKQLVEARAQSGSVEDKDILDEMFSLKQYHNYANENKHLTQRSS